MGVVDQKYYRSVYCWHKRSRLVKVRPRAKGSDTKLGQVGPNFGLEFRL